MTIDRTGRGHRLIGLALTTALASGALAGCTSGTAPEARVSAGKASEALEKGRAAAAIRHAEAAVLAQPRAAEHRVMLGAAYLQAGRFASAETSFAEAMELGDESSRVVVSRALALIATGRQDEAHGLLDAYAGTIDAADLGLAFAMAGDAHRGAAILMSELRDRHNTPKVRQNLAYALALKGDWRSARLLVAEDVPADRIGERLGQWAITAAPEAQSLRVANLLGVSIASSDARPAELALANFPSTPMLAAEAAATMPADVAPSIAVATTDMEGDAAGELPPVRSVAASFADFQPGMAAAPASAEPAPSAKPVTRVAVAPVVAPAAKPVVAASPRVATTKPAAPVAKPAGTQLASGDHLVQLGSYLSEADAQRAWGVLQARYPVLKDTPLAITKAEVKGRIYYRVAAGNLAESAARSLCSTVKARGQGCFAYSEARPLPGTIEHRVQVASR